MSDKLEQAQSITEAEAIAPLNQTFLADEVERHFLKAAPRLERLARLQGVATHNVDDVVQETFLEAWRHLAQLRSPERLDAWLAGICRNVCHRHRRERGVLQSQEIPLDGIAHEGDNEETSYAYDVPDMEAFDPAEALERQDMAILLDRAMGYLPSPARDAIELCYLAELPQTEAASRLGMTISALEARLHRARKQLRHVLNGEMRADAEAFGLVLDAADLAQWRESRDWCLICGKSRLWGVFEPMPDGRIDFRMRCPTCPSGELFTSAGIVDFKGAYSFRPAMKRLATSFSTFFVTGMRQGGQARCWNCRQPVQLNVVQYEIDGIPLYTTWIVWQCRCGRSNSAGVVACLNDPAINAFLLRSSRCIIEPDMLVTFQGAPAARFSIRDMMSGATHAHLRAPTHIISPRHRHRITQVRDSHSAIFAKAKSSVSGISVPEYIALAV